MSSDYAHVSYATQHQCFRTPTPSLHYGVFITGGGVSLNLTLHTAGISGLALFSLAGHNGSYLFYIVSISNYYCFPAQFVHLMYLFYQNKNKIYIN